MKTRPDALTKTVIALGLGVVAFLGIGYVANAASPGTQEPWVQEMNQESYWEDRFSTEELELSCRKYENHDGSAGQDYALFVVKDGNEVIWYTNVLKGEVMQGAINPANGTMFPAPHSWVMKCVGTVVPPTTTTTTVPETTTTTEVEPSTTTTTEDTSTTTSTVTVPPTDTTTSTTESQETTSTIATSSTVLPSSTTTTPSEPEGELPMTGPGDVLLALGLAGLAMTGLGGLTLRATRKDG